MWILRDSLRDSEQERLQALKFLSSTADFPTTLGRERPNF